MGTALQIVTDAVKLLGVYEKGQALDADEGADGLRALNLMIEGWDNEHLALYQTREISHALTSGTGQYTIGRGGVINEVTGTATAGAATTITIEAGDIDYDGQWNGYWIVTTGGTGSGQAKEITACVDSTAVVTVKSAWSTNPDATTTYEIEVKRPQKIARAWVRDSNDSDYGITLLTNDDWSQIGLKSTTGTFPDGLYYRPDFPMGEINLYPLPGSGLTLYLQVWDRLTPFPSLSTEASFPPGYERALTHNLAVEFAPQFGTVAMPAVERVAMESMRWIKSVNYQPMRMTHDLPIGRRGNSRERFFAGY